MQVQELLERLVALLEELHEDLHLELWEVEL